MSSSDDIFDSLKPLMEKKKIPTEISISSFDLDRGTYEVSDYVLKNSSGKEVRWRVFSNSWGDEVLPIARALKETGAKSVVYIGTAGALPDSGLKVGDLVTPQKAMDQAGELLEIKSEILNPKEVKKVNAVTTVSSPLEETKSWLDKIKKTSDVVEIETGHLASVFRGEKDNFQAFLLISDVVGIEGETLAEASSSNRINAQTNVLKSLFEKDKIVAPINAKKMVEGKFAEWIDELEPGREEISRFQAIRKAEIQGISTKKAFSLFVKKEPRFTANSVEAATKKMDKILNSIFEIEGVEFNKIYVHDSFLNGAWNPNTDEVKIILQTSSQKKADLANKKIQEYLSKNVNAKKLFEIQAVKTVPKDSFISVYSKLDDSAKLISEIYKDVALGFGGLAATETRNGQLKFIKVAPIQAGRATPTLAFFVPNEATSEVLKELKGSGTESMLKQQIAKLNIAAGPNMPWEIKYSVVDELASGSLAQIVPEISGSADNLTIHLNITKEGIKNPAVIMEELIHLEQITSAPVAWKANTNFKSFFHPFHWAEVVANAQAGSMQAAEKLARLELEAAMASEDAIRFYKKQGLFSGTENELIEKYLNERANHAEELHSEIAKAAKAEAKQKVAAWERAKKVFNDLEAQKTKLNDLVAKGDRKGVRRLVEKYLPWDIMEPSEKKAWTEWLEAMENPDKSKTKLVFRGMYDDLVMRNADDVPYLMSTVMTKNQGNYTRRLRSLSTLREKFGQTAIRDSFSPYNLAKSKNPTSVTVMMGNHAVEALGSPFLSTASYDVATKFGPRQLGAFAIDERRLVLNALSPDKYLYQHEMLTPLFIFPDEVVHFHDYARNPVAGVGPRSPEIRRNHFLSEVEKKLGRKLTDAEIHGKGTDKEFMKRSYARLREMVLDKKDLPIARNGCLVKSKACDCLFGALNGLLK